VTRFAEHFEAFGFHEKTLSKACKVCIAPETSAGHDVIVFNVVSREPAKAPSTLVFPLLPWI
jgi:hypothetical protein